MLGSVASAVNDDATLIRPNVEPDNASLPARSSLEASAFVAPFARSNAARPAASAADADVPVIELYPPPGAVARMPTPGAATDALPVLLPAAMASFSSVAATPMTFDIPAGYEKPDEPSFPVAATSTAPWAHA